jgi:4-coumarate--CoA ligase
MDTTIYTLNKFTLPTFCASVEKYKLTAIYVVPPVVIGLVKSPSTVDYDLSSLSIGMSGAAPMTEEIGNALKAKLPNLMLGQGYGMTESATIITIFDPSVDVIPQSSAGTLAPNIE